jgi:hypothetical protein
MERHRSKAFRYCYGPRPSRGKSILQGLNMEIIFCPANPTLWIFELLILIAQVINSMLV